MGDIIKSYKGFDKDLKCRGYQYEIGKEYEQDDAECCKTGFHACEYPLDCFGYYAPAESRYCEVEQSGKTSKDNDDSKVASSKIKIGAEIGIAGIVKAAFEYVKKRCTNSEAGKDNCALTGGNKSALTGGDWSALTGGDWSALTGGENSVVYGNEKNAKVRGGMGAVLALAEYDDDCSFIKNHVRSVDGKKIKANTWYTLKNGRFTEIKQED